MTSGEDVILCLDVHPMCIFSPSSNCSMCFRAEIALTDGRLMGIAQELNTTAEEEEALRHTLNDLERELGDLNSTVAQKYRLLGDYLTAGFSGSKLKSIKLTKISHYQHRVSRH